MWADCARFYLREYCSVVAPPAGSPAAAFRQVQLRIQSPLTPENLLKPNGRGIFYMKSFMDEIHYGLRPGGGTVVTLRKHIPAPKTDPRPGETPETGDPEEGNR